MWFKVVGAMFFGVIALALLSDLYVVYTIHQKAGRSIQHALDAGIVQATHENPLTKGNIELVKYEVMATAREVFQESMNVDEKLENEMMSDSQLQFDIYYNGKTPMVEAIFHTQVSFSVPFIEYPVTVKRKIDYQSIYK